VAIANQTKASSLKAIKEEAPRWAIGFISDADME
jgi:hypothetical protein